MAVSTETNYEQSERTPAAPKSTVVSISVKRWPSKSYARELVEAINYLAMEKPRTIWPSTASRTCSRSCSDMVVGVKVTSVEAVMQARIVCVGGTIEFVDTETGSR